MGPAIRYSKLAWQAIRMTNIPVLNSAPLFLLARTQQSASNHHFASFQACFWVAGKVLVVSNHSCQTLMGDAWNRISWEGPGHPSSHWVASAAAACGASKEPSDQVETDVDSWVWWKFDDWHEDTQHKPIIQPIRKPILTNIDHHFFPHQPTHQLQKNCTASLRYPAIRLSLWQRQAAEWPDGGLSALCHVGAQIDRVYPLVSQHSYGKSQSFMGKSTINGPSSIAMLNYQSLTGQLRFFTVPITQSWLRSEWSRAVPGPRGGSGLCQDVFKLVTWVNSYDIAT